MLARRGALGRPGDHPRPSETRLALHSQRDRAILELGVRSRWPRIRREDVKSMGTGMPYWGSIFTEEELAELVDHLWTFSLGAGERAMREDASTTK